MTRFIYAAAQSASTEDAVRFRVLADITMTNTTLRACTGQGYIGWAATTYSPVGAFGGVEKVQEDGEPFARAVRMWLSAVGSAQLYEPLTENLFNKPIKLYRAFLNQGNTLVSTPEMMFSGRINKVTVNFADPTRGNYLELEVENRLRREPRAAWFNKESLQQTYNDDSFFNFIELIPGFRALWGNKATYFTTPPPKPPPYPYLPGGTWPYGR
jgi:hypothetical protein